MACLLACFSFVVCHSFSSPFAEQPSSDPSSHAPLAATSGVGAGARHHRARLLRGGVATAPSSLTRRDNVASAARPGGTRGANMTAPSSLTRIHGTYGALTQSDSGVLIHSATHSNGSVPSSIPTSGATAAAAPSLHSHSMSIGGAHARQPHQQQHHHQPQRRSHSETPSTALHHHAHARHGAHFVRKNVRRVDNVATTGAAKVDQSLVAVVNGVSVAANGAALPAGSPKDTAPPSAGTVCLLLLACKVFWALLTFIGRADTGETPMALACVFLLWIVT